MHRDWWSARDLAAEKLPGLPQTREGCSRLIQRLRAERPDLVRRRAGPGGGWEVSAKALPSEARKALAGRSLAKAEGATPALPSLPRLSNSWPTHFTKRRAAIRENHQHRKTIARLVFAEMVVHYAEFAKTPLGESVAFWSAFLLDPNMLSGLPFVTPEGGGRRLARIVETGDELKPSRHKLVVGGFWKRRNAAELATAGAEIAAWRQAFICENDLKAIIRYCGWRQKCNRKLRTPEQTRRILRSYIEELEVPDYCSAVASLKYSININWYVDHRALAALARIGDVSGVPLLKSAYRRMVGKTDGKVNVRVAANLFEPSVTRYFDFDILIN